MSHFTKLDKANIIDKDAFIKACAELGLTSVLHNAKIKDFYGQEIRVDVAIEAGKYHIALKKNSNGQYDLIADFWGIRTSCPEKLRAAIKGEITDNAIQDMILKHTTKNTIVSKYSKMGYRASVTEDADQNIQVELIKY